MRSCLVVEDSRLARKEMVMTLNSLHLFTTVHEASNAQEARLILAKEVVAVIFLDIHLPGENGFEFLESLEELPKVIFTTAYDQYAIKSFEYNAIDYLLKPINNQRLEKAISKLGLGDEISAGIPSDNRQIFVRDGDNCWFVLLKDIRIFESVGNYVRIHFKDYKPLIYKSLNNLEATLDSNTYFRISRQHIINLNFVEKMGNSINGKLEILMKTGEKLDASRRQSAKIKERFSL